jgi:hypothetical protein
MTRKRRTGKALAERRRWAMQLHLAGFTQEEIADKLDVDRSVVCRDLRSARDARRSGDSPNFEGARFPQRLCGNVDRHPTRCISICKLTKDNPVLRKCPQFHEDSRKLMKITAGSFTTEELPSALRKPSY